MTLLFLEAQTIYELQSSEPASAMEWQRNGIRLYQIIECSVEMDGKSCENEKVPRLKQSEKERERELARDR